MNNGSGKAKVTVAIVPRERFSLTERCIEHIYAFTQEPFELIVIDSNSPKWLGERLKKWESKHKNCRVIRTDRFVYPSEAKNMVVQNLSAETEWVVFVDNDVKVSPHWLTWLLDAARETGARVVHPLYFIEQQGGDLSIHMADGLIRKAQKNGKPVLHPIMNFVGQNIATAANFKRQESGFLEFHTFMIHRDVLKMMGEFETLTLSEDVHYCLRLGEKGERIIFEPRSVITYVAGPPFEKYDLPYFRFRWNPAQCQASVKRLTGRWAVIDGYWGGKIAWSNYHRNRIEPWFPIVGAYSRLAQHSRTVRRIGKWLPVLKEV